MLACVEKRSPTSATMFFFTPVYNPFWFSCIIEVRQSSGSSVGRPLIVDHVRCGRVTRYQYRFYLVFTLNRIFPGKKIFFGYVTVERREERTRNRTVRCRFIVDPVLTVTKTVTEAISKLRNLMFVEQNRYQ